MVHGIRQTKDPQRQRTHTRDILRNLFINNHIVSHAIQESLLSFPYVAYPPLIVSRKQSRVLALPDGGLCQGKSSPEKRDFGIYPPRSTLFPRFEKVNSCTDERKIMQSSTRAYIHRTTCYHPPSCLCNVQRRCDRRALAFIIQLLRLSFTLLSLKLHSRSLYRQLSSSFLVATAPPFQSSQLRQGSILIIYMYTLLQFI